MGAHVPPRVFLVGAGPGHPGLITRRGLALLREADLVISDALVNPELLLEARADAVVVQADRGKGRSPEQRKSAIEAMVAHARKGKMVVRLKGGDPFVFGRVMEEVEALEDAGILFDVVPGVSSAFAVPALAGIPLTDRAMASSVAFVTGSSAPGREAVDFKGWATAADTLVVLMGLGRIREITADLIAGGRSPDTLAAAISWGTVVDQNTVEGTLGDLADRLAGNPLPTPGILVVGDVVKLRKRLAVFERRPLFGLRVVVTRARAQSHGFVRKLAELGARPVLFPTIDVRPTPPSAQDLETIKAVGDFDGIFFTSTNAVRRFFEELEAVGLDTRALSGTQVIAVGKATANSLGQHGIRADIVPDRFSQEGILQVMGEAGIRGRRFLYPRAEKIEETLSQVVAEWGGVLAPVVLYETVVNDVDKAGWPQEMTDGTFDVITFTSPSSVRGFAAIMGSAVALEQLRVTRVVAIGETTARQLKELGVSDVFVPGRSTVDEMLELLIALNLGADGNNPEKRLSDARRG